MNLGIVLFLYATKNRFYRLVYAIFTSETNNFVHRVVHMFPLWSIFPGLPTKLLSVSLAQDCCHGPRPLSIVNARVLNYKRSDKVEPNSGT